MTLVNRWSAAVLGVFSATVGVAQPTQFKANVQMKNGADGSTASGIAYFGGAKIRTELKADGRSMVILADPAAHSQVVLMPSEKMYMQMPIGQGPVKLPPAGPTDPTNPCSAASGNTDCVKGPNETINGYPTVRWDYTSQEGVRTRAWISPTLRFAIKTTDDNGGALEFSDIAEGPQPASLFTIPAGYTKMDVGAMGGMGMARGRGNAGRGNPMGEMMPNLPPEAQAAMAAAMRGQPTKTTTPGMASAATGSAWDRVKGWIFTLTILSVETWTDPGEIVTKGTNSMKYVVSFPLNYGTPAAAGVGPMWTHMGGAPGSPEVLAKPFTLSVEIDRRVESTFPGKCSLDEDPSTTVETMKNSVQKSLPMTQPTFAFRTQSVFKTSADLKTYDLIAGFSTTSKETTQRRTDGKGCRTGKPYTMSETSTRDATYGTELQIDGLPLPSTVSTITGTKKMSLYLDGKQRDATVSWTLTPLQ
jgi:hypothetical protein